jgi:tetratricopeptide (TPR) repeat protein
MSYRVFALSTLVLFATLAVAQRQNPRQTTELIVKVTYENDRAVADQVRIQLTNGSGIPVTEVFTRGEGEARFLNIEPGTYRIRATGTDIEEKISESSFVINPRELTHMEFFTVRKRETGQSTSTQGSISAAALNVPAKAESEFEKGVAAMKKQNFDEARARFNRAVELYPRYAAAYNNLGVMAMQQGRLEEGQGFFEQAVKADEQSAPSYVNLAKSRLGQKRYGDAQDLLTKASSIDPANVEALALLSLLEFEAQQMPAALANARKVHQLPGHEKFAFAHYVAGRVLEAQSLPVEAVVEYRLFLKEAPESPTSAKARASIDAIEKQRK